MKATEARAIAIKYITQTNDVVLEEVRRNIKTSCQKGDMSYLYFGRLPNSVKYTLQDEGYSIKESSGRNEIDTYISWNN